MRRRVFIMNRSAVFWFHLPSHSSSPKLSDFLPSELLTMTTIAAVFPGQGSQSLGMLSDLASGSPLVAETFAQASEVLSKDLWVMAQQGPEADLNNTENTQPLMLAAGVAAWRVWQSKNGCTPVIMAGHSLGEYTALVCADALDFSAAVELVAERGRLMQAAVPSGEGAMAAILGLEDDAVIAVCAGAEQGQVVSAVNFNSPGQVVIAGNREAVERACEAAKEAGAKRAIILPVSVPSHCSLMSSAADQLAQRLVDINVREPVIPVIHNVSATALTKPDEIKQALVSQLHSPVRWVESVLQMQALGATKLIEFGPGKVLTGLAKRIDRRGLAAVCMQDSASMETALAYCEGEPNDGEKT